MSDDRALGMHPLVREFLALEPEPLDLTSLIAIEREEDWIEMARAIGRRRAIAEARQDELAWRILASPAARQSAVDACLAWDIAARHVRGRAGAEESRTTSALYVALEHADEQTLRRVMEQISPEIVDLGGGRWASAAGIVETGAGAVTGTSGETDTVHEFRIRPSDVDNCDIGIAAGDAPRALRRMVRDIWRRRGRVIIWEVSE
ncbi:MAG: hypothetical protein J0H82_27230 [Alphaproteobacteria bacterium]|jgi:hypothetical protein|nr:hypothetical protein [Alphaproteobacteria bacterium]